MGKNKNKKHRRLHPLISEAAPADELISQGQAFIRSAKFRDAVDALKQAAKKGGNMGVISPLLFEAYLNREKQLRAKGMILEADAIHQHVVANMPEPCLIPASTLAGMIADCPIDDAFSAYEKYLKQEKNSHPQIEQVLAGRLFETREWQLVDRLPDENPLKRERPVIREAVCLMETGQWEEALSTLHPVGRKSPFSDVRLFCRAMADFYSGNDADMKRALSLLPEGFPLKSVVETLKNRPGDLACLWDGKNHCDAETSNLIIHYREGRLNRSAPYVEAIGSYLCPDDPHSGIITVIEHVWALESQSRRNGRNWQLLAKKVLPGAKFEQVKARLDFLLFDGLFEDAGAYLSVLKNEFPDSKERDIARSLVLTRTVESALIQHRSGYGFRFRPDDYKTELGVSSSDPSIFLAEMAHSAVCLDPANPRPYALLSKVPRASKKAREIIEDGYKIMMDRFPDDPVPCLELANLYYESNAFRKAENILMEAVRRAPHDRRVEERRQISLLISADQSIRRSRFHLAQRDIALALDVKNPKILPLAIEKQIVYKIENTGQLSLFDAMPQQELTNIRSVVERHIRPLPVFDRLRVLGLLLLEYRRKTGTKYRDVIKNIEKVYRLDIREASKFTSAQVRDLLTPVDIKIRPLIHGHNIALEYLSRTPDLIQQVNDEDIFPVFDFMIASRLLDLCIREIQRRLKSAPKAAVPDFKFHEIAVRHFSGELADDMDAFLDILDDADPADMERLRQTSRRLSTFAGGRLRIAMETFNFHDWDDEEEPFDDFDDNPDFMDYGPGDVLNDLLQYFELLIDGMNLRGAPVKTILEIGKGLTDTPAAKYETKVLKKLIAENSALMNSLSREAKILIFGKE
jgi:tetratricopeptide (TPR) repeat protein